MWVAFAVVFLIVLALAALIVGRAGWRLVRGNGESVPAGSFGHQFFDRRDKPQKPEDWLDH